MEIKLSCFCLTKQMWRSIVGVYILFDSHTQMTYSSLFIGYADDLIRLYNTLPPEITFSSMVLSKVLKLKVIE